MSPDVFVTYLPGRSVACGVERNADKDNCDREHDDANENVHGYSFPI